MENQEQVQPQAEAPAGPELTITDLVNLKSIVETSVRRGVWAANEISAVGHTFDRLNNFLNSVQPVKPEEQK